jgi:hypothetical protein
MLVSATLKNVDPRKVGEGAVYVVWGMGLVLDALWLVPIIDCGDPMQMFA